MSTKEIRGTSSRSRRILFATVGLLAVVAVASTAAFLDYFLSASIPPPPFIARLDGHLENTDPVVILRMDGSAAERGRIDQEKSVLGIRSYKANGDFEKALYKPLKNCSPATSGDSIVFTLKQSGVSPAHFQAHASVAIKGSSDSQPPGHLLEERDFLGLGDMRAMKDWSWEGAAKALQVNWTKIRERGGSGIEIDFLKAAPVAGMKPAKSRIHVSWAKAGGKRAMATAAFNASITPGTLSYTFPTITENMVKFRSGAKGFHIAVEVWAKITPQGGKPIYRLMRFDSGPKRLPASSK